MKRRLLYLIIMFVAVSPISAQDAKNHNFDVTKNLDVFNYIYKNLDLMYVDTLNPKQVIGTAINAMLEGLDPYTVYYPENDVKELKMMLTGKYAGIGSLIRYHKKLHRVVIDEPYEGMPAAEAGLKKGDIIISIDDTLMTNKNTSEVSDRLRGDAGTSFVLKVKRPSTGKVMSFKITRRTIKMPAVPYYGMQKDSIGYINLNSFTEDCSKDVRRAFIDLKTKGARGIVLDLRNNGGGSVSEAVDIVNMFVPKGLTIVSTKGKLKRANSDYITRLEPIDTVIPVAVLVNEETASASEITSGSLQDLDRGIILGTRTYGKGLVQIPMDVPYNGNLKLTTGKYYIPSGRCIQAINYKHNANGSYTEHIPDSLTHVFYTSKGREVRDGGGIKPDIEVKSDTMPNLVFGLTLSAKDTTEVLFDYEAEYCAQHPTVAAPSVFDISDSDYEKFKQRVLKSGFTYDLQSESNLKKLIEIAKFEGYYDDAKNEFKALEVKLSHNLSKDMDQYKDQIKMVMVNDILGNYYYQKGSMEANLRYDKVMKEACRLLKSPKDYNQILSSSHATKK
ncbi:MAG: S41 family peptidase [Bacteroidaceae bacterium]|nr:S41 family peptidase [Bacteroidaceae bacterium]